MSLPWSDVNSNPVADLRAVMEKIRAESRKPMEPCQCDNCVWLRSQMGQR